MMRLFCWFGYHSPEWHGFGHPIPVWLHICKRCRRVISWNYACDITGEE